MRKRRLNFKGRDYITGELKNVGYVEMRVRAATDPEEKPEEPDGDGLEEAEPEEEEQEEQPDEEEQPEKAQEPDEEETVDLYFYGDIGGAAWQTEESTEDKCPQDVQDFFAQIPPNAAVNIHMNSGGGDAYAGIAISNIIRAHKGKTVGHVDGLAASIASVIVSGCDRVIIHAGGQFMVHKPLTIALGNADDFKDTIKRLDACQECITDVYMTKAKAGVTRDQITKLINAESWLNGPKAQKYFDFEVDNGGAPVAACRSTYFGSYHNMPANITKKPTYAHDAMVDAFLSAWEQVQQRQEAKQKADLLRGLDKFGK